MLQDSSGSFIDSYLIPILLLWLLVRDNECLFNKNITLRIGIEFQPF